MLSNFLRLQRAKNAGYVFVKIHFGESITDGRCTYGTTKEDVYNYFQATDKIVMKSAWECYHCNSPTIKSFGRTQSECLTKIKKVLDYVKDTHEERFPAVI